MSAEGGGRKVRWALWVALAAAGACAHGERRALVRASRRLGAAVRHGDAEAIAALVIPAMRGRVDRGALTRDKSWAKALRRPLAVRLEATVLLGPEHPVEVVREDGSFYLAEDPTAFYGNATPRQALRTLVRATRARRWDVLVDLAPAQLRMGLSPDQLEKAWTTGEGARKLADRRDALAEHLGDPIAEDADQAVLELDGGRSATLEREGDRWVIVDF